MARATAVAGAAPTVGGAPAAVARAAVRLRRRLAVDELRQPLVSAVQRLYTDVDAVAEAAALSLQGVVERDEPPRVLVLGLAVQEVVGDLTHLGAVDVVVPLGVGHDGLTRVELADQSRHVRHLLRALEVHVEVVREAVVDPPVDDRLGVALRERPVSVDGGDGAAVDRLSAETIDFHGRLARVRTDLGLLVLERVRLSERGVRGVGPQTLALTVADEVGGTHVEDRGLRAVVQGLELATELGDELRAEVQRHLGRVHEETRRVRGRGVDLGRVGRVGVVVAVRHDSNDAQHHEEDYSRGDDHLVSVAHATHPFPGVLGLSPFDGCRGRTPNLLGAREPSRPAASWPWSWCCRCRRGRPARPQWTGRRAQERRAARRHRRPPAGG